MGFESGAGEFMQSGNYSAPQMRRSVFAWAARATTTVGSAVANTPGAIAGGLFGPTDMQLSNAGSGLIVNVSVGECLIPGQEANSQGGYHGFYSTAGSAPTLAPADATNPRVDAICATAADSAYTLPVGGNGITSGAVTIVSVTGTPTPGATLTNLSGHPSTPLSSLLLGYALVPAGALNLTSGNIVNKATVVCTQSGLGVLARAYINGAASTPASTGLFQIPVNSLSSVSGMTLASNDIMVATAGQYYVSALISIIGSGSTTISAVIYKNGVQWTQLGSAATAAQNTSVVGDLIPCASGDTLGLWGDYVGGTAQTITTGSTGTFVAAFRVA